MSKGKAEPYRAPLSVSASRLTTIINVYGADSARWPDAERDSALRLLENESELRQLQTAEAALDGVLAAMRPVEIPNRLSLRILAGFDECRQARDSTLSVRIASAIARVGHAIWPGAPLWQPVSAVIVSLVLGLTTGALLRPDLPWQESEEVAATSPLDSVPSVDLGGAV